MRRIQVVGLALLSVLALACEGAGRAGSPGSGPDPEPRTGLPSSMVALGDSISAGFGSCVTLVACRRNSFSTGDGARVDSHYRRIRADDDRIRGRAENVAVPGARAADLARQAGAAARTGAQYVTVLIGANDACRPRVQDMTGVGAFRADVDAGLRRLKKGLPDARILVISIPDVYRLWQLGHTDERAVRAWSRGTCASLLARPTSTAPADERRRRQVRDRIDAYDRQLSAACRGYGRHCRYDGGAAHRVRFTLDLVSHLDYFHPSVAGQDALAEATFPRRFTW